MNRSFWRLTRVVVYTIDYDERPQKKPGLQTFPQQTPKNFWKTKRTTKPQNQQKTHQSFSVTSDTYYGNHSYTNKQNCAGCIADKTIKDGKGNEEKPQLRRR